MDLFLNYRDAFLIVKDRFLELQEKNSEWKETQSSILQKVADNTSGNYSDEYQSQTQDALAEFDLLCERVDKMCTILQDEAEPRICHMLNMCVLMGYNLDGMGNEGVSLSREHTDGKDLMYNSEYHETIVSNCNTVDITSDSETAKLGEMKITAGKLKYLDSTFLDTEFSALKTGIARQKYINYFEETFDTYVSEVSDFNSEVSSQFTDVVGEYSDFPEFYRTTNYSYYIDKHYPRIKQAAEAGESEVFDEEGGYGGNQGNPYYVRIKDEEFMAWIKTQPGFENMTDEEIKEYLATMNENGCGYVGGVTAILAAYAGREKEFEKKYGIPYYDENGDINYDKLFFLYFTETAGQTYIDETSCRTSYTYSVLYSYEDDPDAFKEKYGCDLYTITYDEEGNEIKEFTPEAIQAAEDEFNNLPEGQKKVYTGFNANIAATSNNRFEGFCEAHGDTASTVYLGNSITQEELDERTEKGEVIQVSSENFNLYNMDGTPYEGNPVGGHRMTVTEILPDGRIVVSSWGEEYILDPEGADYVDMYSYSIDQNTEG